MPNTTRPEDGSSSTQATHEKLGRDGFALLGGIIGLAMALAFLNIAPARKATALPSPADAVGAVIQGAQTPSSSTAKIEAIALDSFRRTDKGPAAQRASTTEASAPTFDSSTSSGTRSTSTYIPPRRSPNDPAETGLCGYPLGDGTTCRNRVSGGGHCHLHSSRPEPSYTPSYSGGGTVHVRGYYRNDGTYVRPHTRRSPRR